MKQMQFESLGDDRTRVHLCFRYTPPLGVIGHALASALAAMRRRCSRSCSCGPNSSWRRAANRTTQWGDAVANKPMSAGKAEGKDNAQCARSFRLPRLKPTAGFAARNVAFVFHLSSGLETAAWSGRTHGRCGATRHRRRRARADAGEQSPAGTDTSGRAVPAGGLKFLPTNATRQQGVRITTPSC